VNCPRAVVSGLALLALASASWARQDEASLPPGDPRSREVLRRDCASGLGRSDTTLFANGTVRWRERRGEESDLRLTEIDRDRVAAFERRLAAIDLTDTPADRRAVEGAWVEWCELSLRLPDRPARTFRYGLLDTRTLGLNALVGIADELAAMAVAAGPASEIPAGYQPRVGDRLARADGTEFDVMGFTADGHGVELRGRIDPLTIYLPRTDLPRHFVRLVARAAAP